MKNEPLKKLSRYGKVEITDNDDKTFSCKLTFERAGNPVYTMTERAENKEDAINSTLISADAWRCGYDLL